MNTNRYVLSAKLSDVQVTGYADVLTEPVLDAALMRLLKPVNNLKSTQFDDCRNWLASSPSMADGLDVIEHSLPDGFDTQKFMALLDALH